jgi:cytochrome c oxidase subunit 2
MIKVLVSALVGTIVGIVVMVVVIAISGSDTSGATSVGIGPLPLSTYSSTPSTSTGSTPTGSTVSTGGGGSSNGSTGATGDATAGKAVWDSSGCGSCHTLAAAGSTGAVGPNLDTALAGDAGSTPLPAFVLESIVDPDKVIAKSFSGGIMPSDFGTKLSTTDLNNLVALILQGK